MPWSAEENACGFTSGEPWLLIPEEHRAKAVDAQHKDPSSILHAYRTFVRWRREHPVLRYGDIEFLDSPADTLCFVRSHAGHALLACFNFAGAPRRYQLPQSSNPVALTGHGFAPCGEANGRVEIPGYGAFFAELRS